MSRHALVEGVSTPTTTNDLAFTCNWCSGDGGHSN
jgi:hypothetical protein